MLSQSSNLLSKLLAKFALSLSIKNVNTNSSILFYQPKPPESLKKLRKF